MSNNLCPKPTMDATYRGMVVRRSMLEFPSAETKAKDDTATTPGLQIRVDPDKNCRYIFF